MAVLDAGSQTLMPNRQNQGGETRAPEPVDPIVVSVIQHRLLAIVAEMGEAMLRTSYSQILNSSRDFSTAICDLDGRLIAQAEHVPIHVGALPFAAKAMTEFFGDDIHRVMFSCSTTRTTAATICPI